MPLQGERSTGAQDKQHDKLVQRLAQMLTKLNQGESLEPAALAREFNVTPRTIQRDLNERFSYLPLQKTERGYTLDPSYLGRLDWSDLQRFASLAGVRHLFPTLNDDFLRELFDNRSQSAFLVKGHHYEDLSAHGTLFRQLEAAVLERRCVEFRYSRTGQTSKLYSDVQPHKLVNHKGIWYLAAKDGDKLKTFALTRIERQFTLEQTFEPDPQLEATLTQNDGIWLSENRTEVVLKIDAAVAGYFKRRKLIANQVIEKELEDGSLLVSAKVGHANQILPIVRYWIPHIRVISPEGLQTQLVDELMAYAAK